MSRRVTLTLVALGIVVVAVVAYFLLVNPIRGDIGDLQTKIDDERQKISSAKIQLGAAEATRSEGRRNQARLLELAKMIPEGMEVSSLILQLQDLADKAGIEFIQISPSTAQTVEGLSYSVIPLSLSFSGSFYDVSDFIYRAEQMASGPGRLLTVKDISLRPEPIEAGAPVSSTTILEIRMTMYAFAMAAVPAAVPAAPAEGSGSTPTTVIAQ